MKIRQNGVKAVLLLAAALSITTATSCKKPGPVEKAGQRIDDAVDNMSEGESPLKKKGPLERAGESIDDAVK